MGPTVSECRPLAQTKNHIGALEITWEATDADVKAAYFKKAKRFHPDGVPPELRSWAEAAFMRVIRAWEALKNEYDRTSYWEMVAMPDHRPGYWEQVAKPPAPEPTGVPVQDTWVFLARAREYVQDGRFWDAIQLLETESVTIQLRSADRRDAMFLLAFAYSKNPQWRRKATELLTDLLKIAPSYGKARELLANLYDDLGMPQMAQRVRRGGKGDASESEGVR